MTQIPPRLDTTEDPKKRFYVIATASVQLALQQEAHQRGTDLWTLGGIVLSNWVAAGFPDAITPAVSVSPCPSPSSLT